MDMIALNGDEAAMPSPARTVDDMGMFGIGTQQDANHENGLAMKQTGIQATNPAMVAAANQGANQEIRNGGPTGAPAAPVLAKSANNDPGQVVQAGMLPGMGHVGGMGEMEAVAIGNDGWKKWALLGGLAVGAWWLFSRSSGQAAPATRRRRRRATTVPHDSIR